MSYGYIYCFSNQSMPGILKIGMTERTPVVRLSEANASDTWRPPTSYKIEFAKKVSNPSQKEKTLHSLLEKYTERINPRREFFRVSREEVDTFFNLIDGEDWVEGEDEEVEEDEDTSLDKEQQVKAIGVKGSREMAKCFTNGQRIRHTIGANKTWFATYDSSKNKIVCDGIIYDSLSKFATEHVRKEYNPERATDRDGWKHCECEVDSIWVSTYSLPR